jgi:hypothetical protein
MGLQKIMLHCGYLQEEEMPIRMKYQVSSKGALAV